MLLFLAGFALGIGLGALLVLLIANLVTDPLGGVGVLDIPKPHLPKKRLKAGVYHPTNVAQVKKALRMGVDEKDVFQ